MDVVIFASLPARMLCVDVTIRCPHAARYATVSSTGATAKRENERTYTNEVLTLALNPYGRWQPSASQTIHTIAQALAQTGRRSVASIRRQLEEDIETALIQGIADTTLKCLGHVVHDVSPPPRGYKQSSPQSVPPFSLVHPSGSDAEERPTPPTVSQAADSLPCAPRSARISATRRTAAGTTRLRRLAQQPMQPRKESG